MQLAGGKVCSEHKDISLLDARHVFGSVWVHLKVAYPKCCDAASADVDALAVWTVLLCALGNDKIRMLPITPGQPSHLATYSEIKL